MNLHELIDPLPRAALTGPAEGEVSGVCDDSRNVSEGSVFVAVRGATVDGHDYIAKAIESGATAILAEDPMPAGLPDGVTWVLVPDTREALGSLASTWNGDPSLDLRVAGVTGTNGKTTTTFLLHSILKETLYRAGLIGTIRFDDGNTQEVATYTTPRPLELQGLLGRMRENGCRAVAMEVSSQGLEQGRAASVAFDAAIFTNLTQDHLDYHGSMEKYFAAKRILFDEIAERPRGKKPVAVVNLDDRYGELLVRDYGARLKMMTFGFGAHCDFKAGNMRQNPMGMEFQLEARGHSYLVRVPLIGRFNVYNSLAALSGAAALRVPIRDAVAALAEAPQVPGRLENLGVVDGATVYVDYAHTPDALVNACQTLRELNPSRLITVFGCGGDRDREKRPRMGKAASGLSDHCIVTSDNPRSEDPEKIIDAIEQGMSGRNHERIVNREEAITAAVKKAQKGDVVLIAGKGHEDYQELAEGRVPFDDRKKTRHAMNDLRSARKEERE